MRIAVCQMRVIPDKMKNVRKAQEMLEYAATNGADMAVLPEMFNCPYDNAQFAAYSETLEESVTAAEISESAKNLGIYIIAGSIPERQGDRVFNTSIAFDRKGNIIGIHRKVHLFDIDVPGKISFRESDTLAAGRQVTVFDTEFCKVGLAICFDMRFPELMRLMALKGASVIIVPAAFNMTTGPAHWELTSRMRAVDNQVFFVAASPARGEKPGYVAYGHSMVVSPWGDILKEADEKEQVLLADISLPEVERIRNQLPLMKGRREDVYLLTEK